MTFKTGLAVLAVGTIVTLPALAQTTPPPPAGSRQAIPEKQSTKPIEGRSESLSSKLNKSDGVIRPSGNVDPEMKVPAPDAHPNSTPVIPPSATGGDNAK